MPTPMPVKLIITGMILLMVAAISASVFAHFDRETLIVRILDKENVVANEHSQYLIFTDKEVFVNEDSLLEGKFNSSDFYRDIHVDQCYTFEVYGWRIPVFSSYRNIATFTKVDCAVGGES